MICPRCGVTSEAGAVECAGCGVILARARPAAAARERTPPRPASARATAPAAGPHWAGLPHAAWKAAAIGLGLALLLPRFPLAHFLLTPLSTLVHELGHAAFGWLFGHPSLPAFDFAGGGGLTTHGERSSLILLAWVAAATGLAWARPGHVRAVVAGALGAWALLIWRGWDEWLVVAGGHLFELAFGVVFLYRGLTGWGARALLEQPLSCFVGFFLLFNVVAFGHGLATSAGRRAVYQQGKAGIDHDLVTLSNYTWLRVPTLAGGLAALALLAVPATALAATRHRRLLQALGRDEDDD